MSNMMIARVNGRFADLLRILPIIAIMALFSCPRVSGQSSVTNSPSISIGVAQGLSLYVNSGLNFGTVVTGTGTTVYSVAVTDVNAGKVTIQGQWNKTVYVTLTPPPNLASGTNTITYTPRAAYNNTADNPSTSTEWIPPTGLQAGFRLRARQVGQSGQSYIYIFGSIDIGSAPPGNYSGLYVVSVTY